jgi:hypothetical protein
MSAPIGIGVKTLAGVNVSVNCRKSEWAGIRKPLPGACDSATHPTVTQINSATYLITSKARIDRHGPRK